MEYEKCYVFQPEIQRPVKRRRTEPQGLHASWPKRREAYRQAWRTKQNHINEKLQAINATTVTEIVTFLDEAAEHPKPEKIPTGLVLAGPNSALRTSIASHVATHQAEGVRRIYASLFASVGTNLKGVLKTIIQKATSRIGEDDEDDLREDLTTQKGRKLLNYDLQVLQDYVREREIQQVVVAINDTEAFDGEVLSELIEILGCWQSRIPFVCIFHVATSVEFLEQKLSPRAVKCLEGKLFDAALSTDEVEQVFEAATTADSAIWLGPSLASSMIERQTDNINGIDSLVRAVHYAYMSCFYGNALSIFLDTTIEFEDVPGDHFEALRNLPSFQDFARKLLSSSETKELSTLLDSDKSLFDFALETVTVGRQILAEATAAVDLVRTIQRCLHNADPPMKSSLYIQIVSGKLASSPMARSLLLSLRKAPSNVALKVMKDVYQLNMPDDVKGQARDLAEELEKLTQAQNDSAQPLRSEDDVKNSTLRTTVIAQKVELSKQKSALSKQDAAYTGIIRRFSDLLEKYFTQRLVSTKDLVLNEIFVYDLKSPYKDVFTPRPRHAIERALATPHDYLDCDCCGVAQGEDDEMTLGATQPATAVLYQLYLESGNLINVFDLWQAFQAVLGGNSEDENEQRTMASFQRALADLKYLGFLKSTGRRVDHVAKVAWKGL